MTTKWGLQQHMFCSRCCRKITDGGVALPRHAPPKNIHFWIRKITDERDGWMRSVFNFYGGCIRDRPKSHVPEDGVTRFYQLTILHWKGLELLRCCLLFITSIKSIPPPKPVCGVSSDQSIQSPLPINLKKRWMLLEQPLVFYLKPEESLSERTYMQMQMQMQWCTHIV